MNRLASESTSVLRIAGIALLLSALVTSSMAMTGCTTMRTVKPTTSPVAPASWQVKAGDHVEVTVRDGRRVSFTVASVDASGIVGDNNTRYEATDIVFVRRREASVLKSTLLFFGVSFVVMAVLAATGIVEPACYCGVARP